MRYTEKYLEENYSEEDLEEINEFVGAALGLGSKAIRYAGGSKKGEAIKAGLKGMFKIASPFFGGAAFAASAAATKAGVDVAANAAKKAAELMANPDRGRPAAAGFGGKQDPTAVTGRNLAKKVATYNPFDREGENKDDSSPKPDDSPKDKPSDLEAGHKKRREGLFSKRKRG